MQTIRADEFRGHRVRLAAWVKSDHAGSANLWMRIDGFAATGGFAPNSGYQNKTLDFDNMHDRQMTGTKNWKYQEVVLDVPLSAATVNFGLILEGGGQAWVDDMILEVVTKRVRHTGGFVQRDGPPPVSHEIAALAKYPLQPQNLDFEQ